MVGFLVLYIILKKFRKFSGQLFLCYGIWYGTGRAIVEGLRTDSLYIGNTDLRVSQLLSIAIVAVCAVLLVINLIKVKKNPKPIEGVAFFPEGSAKTFKVKKEEKEHVEFLNGEFKEEVGDKAQKIEEIKAPSHSKSIE